MIRLAELFLPGESSRLRLARQVGVTGAIMKLLPRTAGLPRSEYPALLRQVQQELGGAGLTFEGVESHPVPAEKIKLGLPGRDEEIENYLAMIRALGSIGVPLLCYNWMAGLGWYRTRTDVASRGGALVSEFDWAAAEGEGLTEWGVVPEERLWENYRYFLDAVLPEAARAGVRLSLHPDDPPVSPLRGIARILTSADAFRRILAMSGSPFHSVTFCQANFRLMGEDIAALAREWGSRITFVHLRDVRGSREVFRETFHDDGPCDLTMMLRVYHEIGFDGPLRPDHAPTLEGEANDRPGYGMNGKIFALGYIIGALQSAGIPFAR
ncbi:MAG: mannonate dehydratase [Bryobacterales bacterium]|nr:mannonate dehydratase [Bryobacterales bacterium]